MPILSSGPDSEPDRPDRHRLLAESFGTEAERYDRARPWYPGEMVDEIVRKVPGPDVLDVGAGTGIEARQFRAAGCRVLGVEPDQRMADVARRHGVDVEVATFEAWDPAGRDFDAVVSGTAWHWVDPTGGAAKAAKVLRPEGRIALFWNVGQTPDDVTKAFASVYERVAPSSMAARGYRQGVPAIEGYSAIFDVATDGIEQTGAFAGPERWRFDWRREYTTDEWLEVLPTLGGQSQLSLSQSEALTAGTADAIDGLGGRFVMEYATVVITAARSV